MCSNRKGASLLQCFLKDTELVDCLLKREKSGQARTSRMRIRRVLRPPGKPANFGHSAVQQRGSAASNGKRRFIGRCSKWNERSSKLIVGKVTSVVGTNFDPSDAIYSSNPL
jgi:hypothetical protein